MITSVLPNNRPPGSYSDVWRRKRRRCEGSTRRTNVGSNGGKADTTDNHEPLVLKFPTIFIIISFTLSSILVLIDGRGPSFAQAVDPPKAQSTPRHRGLSPDSSSHSEVNNSDAVMDDWSGKYTPKVRSPEDDSTLRETEKKYPDNDEISSPSYEPKTNKLKHRQKHRVVSGGRQSSESEYDAYMHWCEKVLGIQSVVEIREFEYVDHLKLHWEESAKEEYDPQGFDWLKQYTESVEENDRNIDDGHDAYEIILPTKLVRGLAAKYDILPGDIVISIPLYSLLSVPTTIDHDPVLSRILGPDARKMYGWIDTAEYELQLLILAVLYHRSLGKDSPMSHYVDILLGTPTDSFPFLWSDRELNEKVGDEEVKTMARGIRLHLHEMYDEIMGTLVKAKPELFAPPSGYVLNQSGQGDESGWAYSYENFQWAFAMVVSRHHYLPLHDFDDDNEDTPYPTKQTLVKKAGSPSNKQIMHETLSSVSEVTPPANQPTDQWVDEAHNEERVIKDELVATDDDVATHHLPIKHSFLAPLADLINFGPPCLTGSYNEAEHVFELIATCPFHVGQEITFWYSSDCSDVIIANFGFTHPLVPPCEAPEDWEKTSYEWREKANMLEEELWEVYGRVDLMKDALAVLDSRLISCGCEVGEKKQTHSSEANQKLRKNGRHHALRQEGRTQELDQQQLNQQVMEELG